MEPEIPLSIRLQILWDRLKDKISIQRHFLGILDRIDERRGMRKARLEEGRWEVETGQAEDTRGIFRKALHFMRLHWILTGLCLSVAGGVAAFPAFRQWRCDRLIAGAEESLRNGEWAQALEYSRAATQIRPGDLRGMWAVFRAQEALDLPQALPQAMKLLAEAGVKSSGSAMLELLQFLADDQPQGAFLAGYAVLSPEQQNSPPFRALYARLLLRRGNPKAAAEVLEKIPGGEVHPVVQLERIRLACTLGTPSGLDEARKVFGCLYEARNPLALPALRLLAAVPGGIAPEGSFPGVSAWLESHPRASVSDRLIGFDQRWLSGESPDKLVSEATGRFAATHPAEVCAWLNRHRRYAEVVLLATPLEPRDPAVTLQLIEAQLALRLPAGRDALQSPAPAVDPAALAALRIRAAQAGWIPELEGAGWRRTAGNAKAGESQRSLLELARLCRRHHRTAEMEEALAAAWQQPEGDLPLFADAAPLIHSLARRDQLQTAIQIMTNLRRFEGANPELNALVLYYQGLAGTAAPSAIAPAVLAIYRTAPDLVGPEMPSMMHLLTGDSATARKLLEETALTMKKETDLRKAILAAIRWSGQGEERPAGNPPQVSTDGLLPAEARRIREILTPPDR